VHMLTITNVGYYSLETQKNFKPRKNLQPEQVNNFGFLKISPISWHLFVLFSRMQV
jgi:hypothetical protein